MPNSTPSALVTEQGQRIQLRLRGKFYELSQDELRTALGLPAGPPGLGISIDRGRFEFEFAVDQKCVSITAEQLQRRLARRLSARG
jgi:hypothetical protein